MKKKYKKLIIVLMLAFLLTGCTQLLKDSSNKNVQNTTTGQNLPSNIICQPEDQTTVDLYNKVMNEKYDNLKTKLSNGEITQDEYNTEYAAVLDISKLPKCSDFSATDGAYEGIWDSIFIKPLAWLLIKIGVFLNNYGLSIIIVTILIRCITYTFTQKTAMQSENMKVAKPALDKIEKKYKGREDQESLMAKNQEILATYKKYNIKPLSGCVFAGLQLPLFLAFYEAMNRLPAIFEGTFIGFRMGETPSTALANGQLIYVIFPILVILTSYYSFKMSQADMATGDEMQKAQMKMMSNMSVAMISIASLTLSVSISVYWIFNSAFTIMQNWLVRRRKKNVRNK